MECPNCFWTSAQDYLTLGANAVVQNSGDMVLVYAKLDQVIDQGASMGNGIRNSLNQDNKLVYLGQQSLHKRRQAHSQVQNDKAS